MYTESIIFDIDGTLWDTRALVAEGYNKQLAAEGLEHLFVTAEDLLHQFGKIMTEIADNLFACVPVPERYALMDRCMETENRHLEESSCDVAYDGIRATMEILAKKYRLFIVSNSQCGYPQLCIDKIGLNDVITAHLCFGDTGTSKGQTILRMMKENHITDAVYVGDTQGDYEASAEAGIPFVWATYGFGVPERYDAKIDSFPELTQLFA